MNQLIEAMYDRQGDVVGTATGYHDLDALLFGMQPTTLYVIAGAVPARQDRARAGHGPHARCRAQEAGAFFSLEMGQLELTQRMLCAEARVAPSASATASSRARWPGVNQATGRLADAPIWIDDNPNLTIMEIRSKARRLRAASATSG